MATRPHADTKTAERPAKAGADHEAEAARIPSARTHEELAQMAASSIGAQIILDYNSDAALGARGGRGGTIEENTMARDADLIAVGLDPQAPSGPPTGQPWEPPVQVTRQATGPAATGRATRMSSLAAGAITDADDIPEPPPANGTSGSSAPVVRDVPYVSQAADKLNCTMGNWEGEPTNYGYQWKIDGTVAGADSADYTVQSADAGKTATCTVTATNAHGSTAAPPSNEVTITDPGATTTRSKK